MESNQNDYHISFFKPTTDSARRNRNMVVQLVLIWVVAIFGFQFLLKIIEKPTPEPAYLAYEEVWQDVKAGSSDAEALKVVSQSALNVLGKVMISTDAREALDKLVSWTAFNIADSAAKADLMTRVNKFEALTAETDDIAAEAYLAAKNDLIPLLGEIYGLKPNDIRSKIAPLEVHTSMMKTPDAATFKSVEEAMDLYLIHNRSILTDGKFLGFPFHYFYTAVFLLILFVGLCWLYCIRTDMFNRKYSIED